MEITAQEFTRLANNFYNQNNVATDIQRISLDSHLFNYINANAGKFPKYKIAFVWVCLNPHYWTYAQNMVLGAKQFFLPGHQTDFFLWSDIPKETSELQKLVDSFKHQDPNYKEVEGLAGLVSLSEFIHKEMTVIPTAPETWPMPTLMRYHLFLQEEEKLAEYDFVFYCDVDMQFVNVVGDEILGEGLTVAPHPGYYTRKEVWPPFEPNDKSEAFIKRPGFLALMDGKPRYHPFYAAGGLQGGKSDAFIKAMKVMKDKISKDMAKSYVPIWNDETVWNKYLFDILPKEELEKCKFLTPSYIYPDSLIKEYYEPIVWGQSFVPRLVTLTKPFSISKEGGAAVAKMIAK